jgi:hypothetical protein
MELSIIFEKINNLENRIKRIESNLVAIIPILNDARFVIDSNNKKKNDQNKNIIKLEVK